MSLIQCPPFKHPWGLSWDCASPNVTIESRALSYRVHLCPMDFDGPPHDQFPLWQCNVCVHCSPQFALRGHQSNLPLTGPRFWLFWDFGPKGPKWLCSWRGLSQNLGQKKSTYPCHQNDYMQLFCCQEFIFWRLQLQLHFLSLAELILQKRTCSWGRPLWSQLHLGISRGINVTKMTLTIAFLNLSGS